MQARHRQGQADVKNGENPYVSISILVVGGPRNTHWEMHDGEANRLLRRLPEPFLSWLSNLRQVDETLDEVY